MTHAARRATTRPAGCYMPHSSIVAQKARNDAYEAQQQRRRREKAMQYVQRTVSNVGVHTAPEPYCGPRRFEVYHPHVQDQLRAGVRLLGRPPVPFVVKRDEALIRPFGGFRIYWRDIEVGRALSWPDYEACRRLREWRRYSATPDEKRQLEAA